MRRTVLLPTCLAVALLISLDARASCRAKRITGDEKRRTLVAEFSNARPVEVQNVLVGGMRQYACVGDWLFWVERSEKEMPECVKAMRLPDGEPSVLVSAPVHSIVASPKGDILALETSGMLALFDVSSKKLFEVYPTTGPISEEDLRKDRSHTYPYFLRWCWGHKVFFGNQRVDGWTRLCAYTVGAAHFECFEHLPFRGNNDHSISPRGSLAIYSDRFFTGEAVPRPPFATVEVIDLYSRRRAVLLKAKQSRMSVTWTADGEATVRVGGETATFTDEELRERLKTGS